MSEIDQSGSPRGTAQKHWRATLAERRAAHIAKCAKRREKHKARRSACQLALSEQKNRYLCSTSHKKKCAAAKKACECAGNVFEGDLDIRTQSDVEDFRQQQYAIVTGALTIESINSSNPVRNLKGLASLCNVDGALVIDQNPLLLTLEGLENLQRVGGDFEISDNPMLRSIDHLHSLRTVGDDFDVFENSALPEISGFNCLENIGNDIFIAENEKLAKITAFNAKAGLSVGDDLAILENPNLVLIDGFNGVESVAFDICIIENENLQRIGGFGRLRHVLRDIEILENALLREITAFCSLLSVQEIVVEQNPKLHTISGFRNLLKAVGVGIIETPALCTLDAFQCLEVVDILIVRATNLRDLDAFAALRLIDNDVVVEDNPALANIDGLVNVRRVDDDLQIRRNDALKTLAGLSRLQESNQVDGQVFIEENTSLADYCGLQALASANPSGTPDLTVAANAIDLSKEEIALLQPCDARTFFERTLKRWLAERAIDRVVACALARSMTKTTVRKWRSAKKLTLSQATLLLGALDRCLFSSEDQLPPHGAPLYLDTDCCALVSTKAQRFALLTAQCASSKRFQQLHK